MPLVHYNVGPVTEVGLYAVRVDDVRGLMRDEFLIWHEDRWSYPSSDQFFRGPVHAWLGPLARYRPKAAMGVPVGLCGECGAPQFDTPSGVTCMRGHGGAETVGAPNADLFG